MTGAPLRRIHRLSRIVYSLFREASMLQTEATVPIEVFAMSQTDHDAAPGLTVIVTFGLSPL